MAGNFKAQTREKNIFNDYRYPHPKTKGPVNGGKYPGQMTWFVTASGEIGLKCDDGVYDPNNKNANKVKEVKLTATDRGQLFSAIRRAVDNKMFEKCQVQIRRHDFVFEGGRSKRTEKPIVICEFTVLRDKETGLISLGYRKGDYRVKYDFTSSNNNIVKVFKDGQWEDDIGATSQLYTLGYLNWIEPSLNALENARHTPPKSKENNSNSNSDQNYGNNSNSSSNDYDFDEDIDF